MKKKNQKVAQGEYIFEKLKFDRDLIISWDELQYKFLKQETEFIEYESNNPNWYLYCDPISSDFIKANDLLSKFILKNNSVRNSENWKLIISNLKWSGFLVPTSAIQNIINSNNKYPLSLLSETKTFFDFENYFSSLLENNDTAERRIDGLSAFWNFFIHNLEVLKEIKNFDKENKVLIFEKINWDDLLLPSEKYLYLILVLSEDHLFFSKNIEILTTKYDLSEDLEIFIKKTLFYLPGVIKGRINDIEHLKSIYLNVKEIDIKYIKVLEYTLSYQGSSHRYSFIDEKLTKRISNILDPNLTDSIKQFFLNTFIKKTVFPIPTNTLKSISKRQELLVKISKIPFEIILEINSQIDVLSNNNQIFSSNVVKTHNLQLAWMLNELFSPTLIWKTIDSVLTPQWNTPPNEILLDAYENYKYKISVLKEEEKKLDKYLLQLSSIQSISELNRIFYSEPKFVSKKLSETWDNKVTGQKVYLQRRQEFRKSKMEHFGILEHRHLLQEYKDIWLDELLKIQDEVKDYINFVKIAFSTALPIKSRVYHDDSRHTIDGDEFDSKTIIEPQKWYRGDVMKSMKRERMKGEVEQINTFCLDYSGSMDHSRMRNLYKILFLLILGLEKHKSYDAIHFFSNDFFEGVDFSNEYTDQKVLFKILLKISNIESGKIVYGGSGGTNIGAGLINCHKRTEEFISQKLSKTPNINIVSSIFVISDGQPSIGVVNLKELKMMIDTYRDKSKTALKGIYIKPIEDETEFIPYLFGKNNCIETNSFDDAVHSFVKLIVETYKKQRVDFKWDLKRNKIMGND